MYKIASRLRFVRVLSLVILGVTTTALFQNCSAPIHTGFQSTNQSSGSSSDPGGTIKSGVCTDVLPERRVWTLSRSEYDNSVKAILNNTSKQAQTTFPGENRTNGFSANVQAMVVNSSTLNLMVTAAETIASQSLQNELNFIASTLKCTLSANPSLANPDACAVKYISSRGKSFFRRPLNKDEIDDLYATYITGFSNPFPNTAASSSGIENIVAAALQMPQFFYRTELGDPNDTSSPVSLTQYEIASAISYAAAGGPPDSTLLAAADAGQLNTPEAIAAQYQRIMSSADGHSQTEKFILQWLGGDQIANLGTATGPVTPAIATAMLNESQNFIQEAVFNGSGTLSELLTGNYTFVNTELASYYGFATTGTTSQFSKYTLNPAAGRSGLLSQGSFLVSSASGANVPLLHRGKWIRNRLLCEALPTFASVGLTGFVPPPFHEPAPGTTTRQALTRSIVGACYTCHQYFMPLGYPLENFDAFGRYQTTDNGGGIDPSGTIVESKSVDPATGLILAPASFSETAIANYMGLTASLAADPQVQDCFATEVVTYVSGRSQVGFNECAVQTAQTPQPGATKATIQQHFLNYVQSRNFIWRTR